MNRAFIFPGQGSQKTAMGKGFYNSKEEARKIFHSVDSVLGYNLSDIIFNGTKEHLSLTANTQPALMATSIAILKVLMKESGKEISQLCKVVAGHSLGEYTALCAANALTLEDTANLLQIRSSSMQSACQDRKGAMAACIGISQKSLRDIISHVVDAGICQIANDNIEGQIVISGDHYNIDRVIATLKDTGYRVVKLNVSGAFHCDLMKSAEKPIKLALDEIKMSKPDIPVISNISAQIVTDIDEIKKNLVKQVCGTVCWRETMDRFADIGIEEIVEIGSGNVLSNLARKSPHEFKIYSIESLEDLSEFLKRL